MTLTLPIQPASKKPPSKAAGHPNDFQTPDYAVDILRPYLPAGVRIWEPACGKLNIVCYLRRNGWDCQGTDITDGEDFLTYRPDFEWDILVTNPPFDIKDQWIARCYEWGKPFALLLPTEADGGPIRVPMFREGGIARIVPPYRINFETPSGEGAGAWFPTCWFLHGIIPHNTTIYTEDRPLSERRPNGYVKKRYQPALDLDLVTALAQPAGEAR